MRWDSRVEGWRGLGRLAYLEAREMIRRPLPSQIRGGGDEDEDDSYCLTECLPCAATSSFNPHRGHETFIPSMYKRRHWGSQRLTNLTNVTLQVKGRAGMWIRVCLISDFEGMNVCKGKMWVRMVSWEPLHGGRRA